ncbi:MAG: DUF1957 domain-containing protein [Chloroflexi bacterium SZAS-1]|jgi:1,4-alpha-glucan branching enzyme|nr:DUF1957 domain-containing protein [Chloroflexi bacterium SZAS-1]HNP88999.1 DUF1957 domain-containing protein [Kouleothrix sp.]
MNGYLAIILTGHVPYRRAAGREPTGEDQLHEAIVQSIIPILNALYDLRELGIRPYVGLAYSPLLLEQLADNVVQKHCFVWMERRLEQITVAMNQWQQSGEQHRAYLARFYLEWGYGLLKSFQGRYNRNLVAALRELCAEGVAEPLSGAATHAYLPLLESAAARRAQIDVGALATTRLLGTPPRGLWLPECGYTPALEPLVRPSGLNYLIVDPSSVAHTNVPYLRPRWLAARQLAVLVRDPEAATQVMAPELGYVGDPLYRAARREQHSGLALWRTGLAATATELYDPYDAFRRAQEHAVHFSSFIAAELEQFRMQHDRPGIAVVPLDMDVLGCGWFEGPTWLRAMIEAFNTQPRVALTTFSAYLGTVRPRFGVTLRDGSWAADAYHHLWSLPAARRLQWILAEVAEQLAMLVQRYPNAEGERDRVLAQAVRELLLAQSSDWIVQLAESPGEAALERPMEHLRRCKRLCHMAQMAELSDEERTFLEKIEEWDNPFPMLNYRVFAA